MKEVVRYIFTVLFVFCLHFIRNRKTISDNIRKG
nr:MAG TPA_asm: hypothetical protein [Caudoviricetes sp.]